MARSADQNGTQAGSTRNRLFSWRGLLVGSYGFIGACLAFGFLAVQCGQPLAQAMDMESSLATWGRATDSKELRISPEYDRKLRRVVISLDPNKTNQWNLELVDEFLRHVPAYTKTYMMVGKDRVASTRLNLAAKKIQAQVKLIPFVTPPMTKGSIYILFSDNEKLVEANIKGKPHQVSSGSVWIQDLFEPAISPTGKPVLLRPIIHKYFYSLTGSSSDVRRDNAFVEELQTVGVAVKDVPLAFDGGNVMVDRVGKKTTLFCGGDILRLTSTIITATEGKPPTKAAMRKSIKASFGADQVVFFSADRQQPYRMYHLDQAMLLLPDKRVAVARIVGPRPKGATALTEIAEATAYLAQLRRRMGELGYRVFDIEVTTKNVLEFQHYVNAIPYVDAKTGQKTLLMPRFKRAISDLDKALVRKNTRVFTSLGYKVIPVPTKADQFKGGIHCLVNVLD